MSDLIENHRFLPLKEIKYKNCLTAVRDSVKEMKTKFPEFVGFTLTGSYSYGKPKSSSDIDGRLFINPEIINDTIVETVLPPKIDGNEEQCYLLNSHNHYEFEFRELMIYKLPFTWKPHCDILAFPLSKNIIDKSIGKLNIYRQLNLISLFHAGIGDIKQLIEYREYALKKIKEQPNGDSLREKLFTDIAYIEAISRQKYHQKVPNVNISSQYTL